jgi:hypothetical protein
MRGLSAEIRIDARTGKDSADKLPSMGDLLANA